MGRDIVLDRSGPRHHIVGGRRGQLARPDHETEVRNNEDRHQRNPPSHGEHRAQPHHGGGGGADAERNDGGFTNGVDRRRRRPRAGEVANEPVRIDEGQHQRRQHHGEGHDGRDSVDPEPTIGAVGTPGGVDPQRRRWFVLIVWSPRCAIGRQRTIAIDPTGEQD